MVVEAPFSKFRKNTYKIWVAAMIFFSLYCVYDGYFNENFQAKHTDSEGNPDPTLVFNRKAPAYLIGAAVLLASCLGLMSKKKIVAEDDRLVAGAKRTIPYSAIQKIDKTYFESKGYFVITYKDENGRLRDYKVRDKSYDNLPAVLELLVTKIS